MVIERHRIGLSGRGRGEQGVAMARVHKRLEEMLRSRVRGAIVTDGLLPELRILLGHDVVETLASPDLRSACRKVRRIRGTW